MLMPPAAEYCKGAEFVQVKSSVAVKRRLHSHLPPLQPLLQPLPLLTTLVAEQQQQWDPTAEASANHVMLIQSAQSPMTGSSVALAEEEDCRSDAGPSCCSCSSCRADAAAEAREATPCGSLECLVPESAVSLQQTKSPAVAAVPDLPAAARGTLPSTEPGSSEGRGVPCSCVRLEAAEAVSTVTPPVHGPLQQYSMAVATAVAARSATSECAYSRAAAASTVGPATFVGLATSVGPTYGLAPLVACHSCRYMHLPETCYCQPVHDIQPRSAAAAPTVAIALDTVAVTTVSTGYAVRRRPSLPPLLESNLSDRLAMGNRLDTSSAAATPIDDLPVEEKVALVNISHIDGQASIPDSAVAASATVSFPPPPSTPPSDDEHSSTSSEDEAATAASNECSMTEASVEDDYDDDDDDVQARISSTRSLQAAAAMHPSRATAAVESHMAPVSAAQGSATGDVGRRPRRPCRSSLIASVENGQLPIGGSPVGTCLSTAALSKVSALSKAPATDREGGGSSSDGFGAAVAGAIVTRPLQQEVPTAATASQSPSSAAGNSKAKPELARMRLTLDLTDRRLPWEAYNPARRLAQLLPVPPAQYHGSGSLHHQQRGGAGFDPRFASLPNTRKARSAEPPSPNLAERSALLGIGCAFTADPDHGAPRSPTLLDELHRRYYGCQKPTSAPAECGHGQGGGGCDATRAAAIAPPTIVLPSDSSPSPVECAIEELVSAKTCPTVSSDSSKSHMNMFGDVGKMFRAAHTSAQSLARTQSHDQSPTTAEPKGRSREGHQHLPGLPTGDAATVKHLVPPSPKLSATGLDGGSSKENAGANVGASNRSRVAKLTRAFSLSPQILRRKYRPATAAAAAVDDHRSASAAAAVAPATIARDKIEHHGSSLPASLGRKKTQEIEVLEACSWLAEVGFPQYLQMFEEGCFPLELSSVEKDHAFLETQLLHCLFRRLAVLNRCAHMKLELTNRKLLELHSEDDQQLCALSDKWRVNQKTGRWLRVDDLTSGDSVGGLAGSRLDSASAADSSGSSKNMHVEALALGGGSATMPGWGKHRAPPAHVAVAAEASSSLGRPGALLRSFGGSLRSARRSRRQPASPGSTTDVRTAGGSLEISSPVLICTAETDERLQRLGCASIGGGSPLLLSKRSVSPSDALNNNDVGSSSSGQQHKPVGAGWLLCPDGEADDCHPTADGCITAYLLPADYVPGTFPRALAKAVSMPTGLRAAADAAAPSKQREPAPQCSLPSQQKGGVVARVVRSTSLDQQPRSSSSALGEEVWHASNRHSVYDNVPSAAAALVGCSDEVTQLELALRELLELNRVDRENDGESSAASLSPPLAGHSCDGAEDKPGGTMPDSGVPGAVATTPNLSPPATPLTERGGAIDEKAGQSADAQTVESRNDAGIEPDIVSAGGSSNHEATSDQDATGSKEDVSSEATWHRERRDSGVGSSLTREPSGGKRKPRLRWHSFVRSHRPSMSSENLHVAYLPAGQLMVLQKLCKLYISSVLEEHCLPTMASQNAAVMNILQLPKFVKRAKVPDYTHKRVFGVPLSVVQQRSGQPLPQCILYAMRYLRKTATDAVGIFRKSGVKSRIEKLHDDLEANPDMTDFEGLQAYDVADLLKKYFRELPECLLTTKLSQTFLAIQQCVPSSARLEAMQACTLLMPCENREAFEALLCFLSDMADHSGENQMTASNLAVCFAPSLFDVCGRKSSPVETKSSASRNGSSSSGSSKMALPDQKELLDQRVAHECLTHMITDCRSLFKVPEDFLAQCHCSYMEAADPLPLAMLSPDYRSHIESCIQGLLKESREGFKGWDRCQHVSVEAAGLSTLPPGEQSADVELWNKKVGDGNPLRLWRTTLEIEAPPVEVLDRVLRERHAWDEDFAKWRTVEKLDADTDIFQYACSSVPPQPQRDYVELRSWRKELPGGACVLVSHSIDWPGAQPPPGGGAAVRGVVLASSYLVEPCGTGCSRLTHVSRVDMRGRPPDWYGRQYGHLEAGCLVRLRDTFRRHRAAVVAAPSAAAAAGGQQADTPETSV